MKLSDKLQRIRSAVPHGPTSDGQLYADIADTRRSYKRITLYTLFRSNENTHLIRPHVFDSKEMLTPNQWHNRLALHHSKIIRGGEGNAGILEGMSNRTGGKQWAVVRIIGWVGGDASKSHALPTITRAAAGIDAAAQGYASGIDSLF